MFAATKALNDYDASGGVNSEAAMCWGMAVNTLPAPKMYSVRANSYEGDNPTDTHTRSSRIYCLMIPRPTTQGDDWITMDASGFLPDQIKVIWGGATVQDEFLIDCWAIAGNAVSADIVYGYTNSLANGAVQIPLSGGGQSVPSAFIFGMAAHGPYLPIEGGVRFNAQGRIGFASYDGTTIRQCCQTVLWNDNDSSTPLNEVAYIRDNRCMQTAWVTGDTAQASYELTDVTQSYLEITTRDTVGGPEMAVLCLYGVQAFAGVLEFCAGGTTGTESFALPGGVETIYPSGVVMGTSNVNYAELNTRIENVRGGVMGMSFVASEFIGPSEGGVSAAQKRTALPTETFETSDDSMLFSLTHTGTLSYRAVWDSYNEDGFTYDITSATANSKAIPFLMLGQTRVTFSSALAVSTAFPAATVSVSSNIIQIGFPSALTVSTAFPVPVVSDGTVHDQARTAKLQVVQSGLVGAAVTHSGLVKAQASQSGLQAATVAHSGLLKAQAVQSGMVAASVTMSV